MINAWLLKKSSAKFRDDKLKLFFNFTSFSGGYQQNAPPLKNAIAYNFFVNTQNPTKN